MGATQADPAPAEIVPSASKNIGVLRLAATAGVSAAALFVLCWVGTFIPFSSPTHAYIALFTLAEPSSVQALVQGICWSLLFGVLAGAAIAIFYNAFSWLQPR